MKKIFATFAALILAASLAFAQDLAQATELYNNGAAALSNGEKTVALDAFTQALNMATALGEEGKEVVENCKNAIPKIIISLAKDAFKASNFDEAIAKVKDAAETAAKFGDSDIADEAGKLLPQFIIQKGNSLIKADPVAAANAYKEALALDTTNGGAALRLGQALNASGDFEGAVNAFQQAAENGQEANALKQLSTIHLKKASTCLKEKKLADAVALALKANEYSANPQALQVAGTASQLAGKNNDAIKYFTQYLEAAPTAKNAGQIAYTVGALYQGTKNIEKAKEYYQKATTDPKYGAEAKKLLDALK